MAPVVSVYPASAESTEHERLMRFQSRLPGRVRLLWPCYRKRCDTTAALERRSRSQRRVARTVCAF